MALLIPSPSSYPPARRSRQTNYRTVCAWLSRRDPVLGRLIDRIGPCRLSPRRDYFATLCDSIIAQQLSTRVADVISDRYVALFPGRRPSPRQALTLSPSAFREIGLSNQKSRYVKDLAAGFLDGRIRPRAFPHTANEELIAMLTSIHGVGRWTAEMFLMFALNRQDVLPVDDLGIQKAIQRWYGFSRLPAPRTIRRIGRAWSPYETIACWYLWRSLG